MGDTWEEAAGSYVEAELDTTAVPTQDQTVTVSQPVDWVAQRKLTAESGPSARASWHCARRGKVQPGRFPAAEVQGNRGKPDPNWDEEVEVAVRDAKTGKWLRKFRRFSQGATSLRVILNPGEKCMLANYE